MDTELIEFLNNAYFKESDLAIFEKFLKPTLEKLEEGLAVVKMEVIDDHLNLHRMVHGGVLATLADFTMGIAAITHNKSIVTTDMSISYIKNVTSGKAIEAVGSVTHNGNKMIRTTCDIFDEGGNLLVKAIGSYFVLGELDLNSFNNR